MNIAINTRLLLPYKLEGIGWFTYEVVKRITQNHPEHTFYLFFDRKFDEQFVFGENCKPVVLHPQARHPILYKIWFDFSVPRALKKHNIDLFLSPDGFLSNKTNVPQIPVIHDLNFEHIPEDLPGKDTKYYQKNFPIFAHKAKHIITVSEFSKQDIHKTYHVPLNKITVAYNGASDLFQPISIEEKQNIRAKHTSETIFMIYVGALHSRKNIVRMLQAFDLHKTQNPSELKLVIVGEKLFKSPEIDVAFEKMKHAVDVIFTGRLSQEKLVNVVAAAQGMVYVSYFEGFGIPVLEAMKCGVPVLTSNVTSLPEVGGDKAFYCDPMNVESIAQGMNKLVNSKFSQEELLERAHQFNWDKTAEKVWEVIIANSK